MSKYKNNKGFTLVELLAVVVVLAIIVVLALTKIKNSVKKGNQDAIVANGLVFIKAVNDEASQSRITNKYIDDEYSVSSLYSMGLSLTGTKPDGGYVVIENGEVVSGCLSYKGEYAKIEQGVVSYSKSCDLSQDYTYAYLGSEEVFTATKKATYRIEVWGAQGGDGNTAEGGYGGYATGTIKLNQGDKLYINVGQQGGTYSQVVGNLSYNGGGAAGRNGNYTSYIGSGGGATSVALSSGELKNLSGRISDVVIVAGGGGGADYWQSGSSIDSEGGGAGGGYIGVNGKNISHTPGTGGTQTAGGAGGNAGSFGLGASGPTGAPGGAGGGGGFYGGGASRDNAGAGGGSGYIANTRLQNKAMYCFNCSISADEATLTITTSCASESPKSNCSKKGNGYVKITQVSNGTSAFDLKFNDYKKLSYVGSNGTQSILTNIIPSNTLGVKATISSSNTSSDLVYFGSKGNDQRYWVGNYDGYMYFGLNGSTGYTKNITANTKYVYKYNYNNDRKFMVDDEVINSSMATLGNNTMPIALFAGNNGGTISYKSSIKLYDFSVTDNQTEIYHYIPCERSSDGVVGLCDLITGNFITVDQTTPLAKGEYIN